MNKTIKAYKRKLKCRRICERIACRLEAIHPTTPLVHGDKIVCNLIVTESYRIKEEVKSGVDKIHRKPLGSCHNDYRCGEEQVIPHNALILLGNFEVEAVYGGLRIYSPEDHGVKTFTYRAGSVPGIHKWSRGRNCLIPRHHKSLKSSVVDVEDETLTHQALGGIYRSVTRTKTQTPDPWHDFPRRDKKIRNWKRYRKTQYKPLQ